MIRVPDTGPQLAFIYMQHFDAVSHDVTHIGVTNAWCPNGANPAAHLHALDPPPAASRGDRMFINIWKPQSQFARVCLPRTDDNRIASTFIAMAAMCFRTRC